MDMKVINLRTGSWGQTVAFFDVILDNTFVVRGFALKTKRGEPNNFYWSAPSKPRQRKVQVETEEGPKTLYENQIGEDGFAIYDAAFDLYGEKDGEKYTPTEAAFEGRKKLIDLAVEQYKSKSGGARASTKRSAPAAVSHSIGGSEDADELPF